MRQVIKEAMFCFISQAGLKVTHKKEPENPIPRPFEVPRNVLANVLAALASKSLIGNARSKLIAQSIYR